MKLSEKQKKYWQNGITANEKNFLIVLFEWDSDSFHSHF